MKTLGKTKLKTSRKGAHVEQDLGKLIEASGKTNAELSRLANGKPQPMQWARMRAGGAAGFPTPDTIRTLARVLNVSTRDVVLASARSCGLTVGGVEGLDLVIADGKLLPATTQEAILTIARDMSSHNVGVAP